MRVVSTGSCANCQQRERQTEIAEFEAEKVLLHSHARKQVAYALEAPSYLKDYRKVLLKGGGGVGLRLQCL